ncbi:MAG TPA: DinB family protein [Candidatus Angelobacter sp.]
MTPQERARIIKLLQDSEKEYVSYIVDVSEAQWNWKPGPDRWSVGQTAEHILLAESVLFRAVQQAINSPADPDWEEKTATKTELLERVMPDRTHKGVAPESVQPQGLAKAEVIRRFKELRGQTIEFAQETQVPLKEHTLPHPFPIFKVLNAYQWLLYIPLHNLRHDQQIAEVKASPGYPSATGQPDAAKPVAQAGSPMSGPSPEALESFQSQMRDVQTEADQLNVRVKTATDGLGSIKIQMASQGLGLRSDVLEAEARMNHLLEKAQREIASGDAVGAEHDLQMAGYAIDFVDKFLGH